MSESSDDKSKVKSETQETLFSAEIRREWQFSRNESDRKKAAERRRLRYREKHGAKKKIAKTAAERMREMRTRKKSLLQTARDRRRVRGNPLRKTWPPTQRPERPSLNSGPWRGGKRKKRAELFHVYIVLFSLSLFLFVTRRCSAPNVHFQT